MKQKWSREWSCSKQTRKQRKYRHNAPLHVKHKFLSAHLASGLRKQFGMRSVPVRKGDEVEVMRGEKKGLKGNVERVDMSKCVIYVDGITMKKSDDSDIMKPLEPSNLRITKLKTDDKMRQKVFERAEKKAEKKTTTKPAKESEPSGKKPAGKSKVPKPGRKPKKSRLKKKHAKKEARAKGK